jgi:UDP-glucose 4-epimerase
MAELSARETVLVTGAAGFVGSHLADRLLEQGHRVVGIDNLSRGTRGNLQQALRHPAFSFVEADLSDLSSFRRMVAEFDIRTVWHMAANSDIPGGIGDPNVDFRDTLLTTFNTLALMREAGIPRIAFASTSAVYGIHDEPLRENTGP